MLIIDGLTKRFRLPGWRVAWIIGPKEFIKASVSFSLSRFINPHPS